MCSSISKSDSYTVSILNYAFNYKSTNNICKTVSKVALALLFMSGVGIPVIFLTLFLDGVRNLTNMSSSDFSTLFDGITKK